MNLMTVRDSQDSPLRSLIAKLMSSWGSNNAAARGGIYGGAPAAAPAPIPSMPQPPTNAMADEMALGDRNAAALAAAPARRPAAAPARRGYDEAGMNRLVGQINSPELAEGPNARIDDGTRARALAWALRQNGGG
jgi:hypothetical protein